jgi:hypothetical protein
MNKESNHMEEIVRGTTPTISYSLPFSSDLLAEAFVTVEQRDAIVIEKELSACERTGNTLTARLTQDDTLSLKAGTLTKIRLVVKTTSGDRLETKDSIVRVSDTHKNGVI